MASTELSYQVPLDGFAFQLRRAELKAVAAGLGEFDASEEGNLFTLADALRRIPAADRAPTWEVAVRRFGHGKPLAQVAGEIGLDEVHAQALLDAFTRALAAVPPPEHQEARADPSRELETSAVARVMAAEMLGNAVSRHEAVDVEAAHEASLRAASELRDQPPGA